MNRGSIFIAFVCLFFASCKNKAKEEADLNKSIVGDWLVLYPDHDLDNSEQRKIYGTAQDSIISLSGLKTVSFRDKEVFVQMDSIFRSPGKWHLNEEGNKLFIRNGGKGFDFFEGTVTGIKNDTLRILENVSLKGQTIKLVWHLKRITDKKSLGLFNPEKNAWRKVNPAETDVQLQKKMKDMLLYYSAYYEMIANESAYFTRYRVPLPFQYYQHSIAMRLLKGEKEFRDFFYDAQQAEQGYGILVTAVNKIKNRPFPSGKNFVIEYSVYMNRLADAIE